MPDAGRIKEQLMNELAELRQRIAELEASEAERKREDEALKEREAHYKTLVETALEGISITDQEETITFTNRAFAEMLGYKPEELVGQNLRMLVSEEDWLKICSEMEKRRRGISSRYEVTLLGRKGLARSVIVSAAPFIGSDGRFLGSLGVIMDITERKQAEELLRESQEKFSVAFRSSPDIIAITTIKDGRYVDINDNYSRFTGYSREELIGRRTREIGIWARADDRDRMFQILKEKGKITNEEFDFRMNSGEVRTWRLSAEPIIIRGEACLIGVSIDITEQKRRQQLQQGENHVLHLLGQGVGLSEVLEAIVRLGEHYDPGIKGSVLLFDSSKELLTLASAPSLPSDYTELLKNGLPVGPNMGSCGTAAYRKERVIVPDIKNSPLFKSSDEAIKRAINNGLLSSFSQPIISSKGALLGTIANYSNKVGEPNADSLRVLEWSARIAAIAIERKRDEETLQKSEKRYKFLYENSPSINLIIGIDGTVKDVSSPAIEKAGYTKDEIIGKPVLDLVAREQREEVAVLLERSFKGEYTPEVEIDIYGKDESIHTLLLSPGQALLYEEGQFTGILITGTDITERKRMEEKLNRMSNAVNMATDSIVISDLESRIIDVNEATLRMYGTDNKSELVGKNSFDLIAPEEREIALEGMKETLEKGHMRAREYHIFTKDGSKLLIEVSVAVIKGTAGTPIGFVGVSRDITERKQMEEALKVSEEKFKNLFELSPLAIVTTDLKGVITACNTTALKLTGYSNDEIVGKHFSKLGFLRPRDVPKYMTNLTKIIRGKVPEPLEVTYHRKDGTPFLAKAHFGLVEASDGKVDIQTIFEDITKRKQVAEALRESEERYRTLFELSPIGITTLDMKGVITACNATVYKEGGYIEADIVGKHFSKVTPIRVSDMPKFMGIFASLLRGKVPKPFDMKYNRKDGTTGWTEVHIGLLKEGSKNKCIQVLQRDITERKWAGEALKQAEENFRRSMDDSPLGIRIATPDGELLYTNKAILDIHGYSTFEELKDTPTKQRYTPEAYAEHRERVRKRKLGEFVPSSYEISIVRKDGQVCHLQVFRKEVLWNGERQFQALYQDITERKLMEEERLKFEKLESVGILAGGIAHDFNNILTGILGNITLAERYLEPEGKAADRLLEAKKASLRAKDLTQQLLTFSKGGVPIKKTVSIAELIQDSATFALRGSKVRCEFSLPDDLWLVEVDEGQMSQVITNLVINADEAMPGGGIINIGAENILIKRKKALLLPSGKYVEITVEDHGVGIPKEHLGRIFDPYFTTKQKGSGLGLATTYSIIKSHGGHITAESRKNVGTTFHIYLPASEKPDPVKEEVVTETLIVGQGRILVMDDEEIIREMLVKMLPLAGYKVELTNDGAEAIGKYVKAKESGKTFDAVIMDLTIPGGMGGREAVKKILEIDPDAKVIVSSGYATDPIMAEYKKYGFKAVVTKPYSVGELERTLHSVLGRKKK